MASSNMTWTPLTTNRKSVGDSELHICLISFEGYCKKRGTSATMIWEYRNISMAREEGNKNEYGRPVKLRTSCKQNTKSNLTSWAGKKNIISN